MKIPAYVLPTGNFKRTEQVLEPYTRDPNIERMLAASQRALDADRQFVQVLQELVQSQCALCREFKPDHFGDDLKCPFAPTTWAARTP